MLGMGRGESMAGMADRIVEARKAMKRVQEALAEKVGESACRDQRKA